LIGFLPGCIGNHDPAGRLVFRIEALHDDAIVQGTNFHHDKFLVKNRLMAAGLPAVTK
jgi:hypothetical protein